MFNKKSKKILKKSNDTNITFRDINTVAKIQVDGKDLHRLEEFTKTFLAGATTVYCNKVLEPNYYIHKVCLETFDRYGMKLDDKSCEYITTPLTEFELTGPANFFHKADSVDLELYVTFDKETKNGFIIHIKVEFR